VSVPKKKEKTAGSRKRPVQVDLAGLGKRVRDTRNAAGLKQAGCPGINGAQVCKLEAGQHRPNSDNLLRIARWLGVRADWLLDGTPPRWLQESPAPGVGVCVGDTGAITPDQLATLIAERMQDARQRDGSIDEGGLANDEPLQSPPSRRKR